MQGEVSVRDVLTREYVGVSESDAVGDAVDLMLEEETLDVVVLRGSEPVGMLTATDALAVMAEGTDPGATSVAEGMSGTAPTVRVDAPLSEAAGRMAAEGVTSLLATEDGDLVGVVSERDVVRATASMAGPAGPADAAAEPGTAAGEVVHAAAEPSEPQEAAEGGYSRQSVCENCGTLTPDLHDFNGQLICEDCREI